MYDLEIILPICSKDYYLKRFINFCKFGLNNIGNYKVLLNFLAGDEVFPEEDLNYLIKKNIDIKMHRSRVNHPAAKVYDFYFNYDDFSKSKWIVRLDDDSCTNVSLLLEHLFHFDYKKEYYFTPPELTIGDAVIDENILKKFNLFENLKYFGLEHEIEIAIFSNLAFANIIKNNMKIIEERSKIEDGYTDQLFCYLSKLLGIMPYALNIITCENKYHEFLINKVAHIHYIYKNEFFINILNNINNNINNNVFLLQFDSDIVNSKLIYFKENSIIHHSFAVFDPDFCFWSMDKDKNLRISDIDGNVVCLFEKFDVQAINVSNNYKLISIDEKYIESKKISN